MAKNFDKNLSNNLYAHRGYHSNTAYPCENTLEAFSLAVENGYGIEFDVQLTKDNIPVVFHDKTLKRMLGIDSCVHDLNYSYLSTLKLPCGNIIPKLEDVLNLVDGKVPLLVEIKHHAGAKLTSQLAYSLLKKYKGDYTVESFHPLSLYLFKKNAPNVIRGQLSSGIFHKNDLKSPIARFVMKYMLTNIISSPHFIAYNSASDDNLSMKLMKHLFKPTLAAYTLKTQQELDDAINKGYTMLIFEGFKPEL